MEMPIKMKLLIAALKTTYGANEITVEHWNDKEGDAINIILPLYDCEGNPIELHFDMGGRPFDYSYFGLRRYYIN